MTRFLLQRLIHLKRKRLPSPLDWEPHKSVSRNNLSQTYRAGSSD